MPAPPSLRDAELAILNAAFEERGWERAVVAIAEATRSSAAQLLGIGGPLLLPLNVFVGAPASYRNYIESPEMHGECNWRVGSTTVPMAVQHEAHYQAYRAVHDTADYDDAASEMDIPFGCQSALLLDSNMLLGLALLRSRRDGPCTAETLRDFTLLRHQLARAVRMQIALDGEAADLMIGDMAALHGAILLLDRHGSLCALSPAAEGLFGDGGPLALEGLSLRLHDRKENQIFQRRLAILLSDCAPGGTAVQRARGLPSNGAPPAAWQLFITRLPNRPHGLGFDPHLAITLKPLA